MIPVVAQQTQIGSARLQAAQDDVGLSNEAIARTVHVSEKTWRRWKLAGAIPTASLPAVAKALRLELRELDDRAAEDRLERVEQELRQVRDALGAVEEMQAAVVRIEEMLREREVSARSS